LLIAFFTPYTPFGRKPKHTTQDTLAGSNTPQRSWWDVERYDVEVTPDFDTKTSGEETPSPYTVLPNQGTDYLQVDLQKPMQIDSIYYNGKMYINNPTYTLLQRRQPSFYIRCPKEAEKGSTQSLTIVYHGKPKEATECTLGWWLGVDKGQTRDDPG
jgi:hypothetical protein